MKKLIYLSLFSFVLFSCGNSKKSGSSESSTNAKTVVEGSDAIEAKDAVCLLNKLSVRATPSNKGKWVTSMSLGEVVSFTGETAVDSVKKQDYYKVKLLDGKEGWARSTFLVVDGKVGVFLEESYTHKRPDLLTKQDSKFMEMDIIAVVSSKDDWVKVKGKRAEGKYIEEAWVKNAKISNEPVDVAVAKFGNIAFSKEDMADRVQALREIVDNPDLSSSSFIPFLKDKLAESEVGTIDNVIEEVEEAVGQ